MTDQVVIIQMAADGAFEPVRDDLVALLQDAVAHGASVGWVNVPSAPAATTYWQGVAADVRADRTFLLLAMHGTQIVGTVQLQPGQRENGRHRGEVAKLLVHSARRRQGIGMRLMQAVEALAWQRGLALIFLDTRSGDAGEQLYLRLGWQIAGSIPAFARSTSGVLEATTFMYKLPPAAGAPA